MRPDQAMRTAFYFYLTASLDKLTHPPSASISRQNTVGIAVNHQRGNSYFGQVLAEVGQPGAYTVKRVFW
jgi:hypothetical protein